MPDSSRISSKIPVMDKSMNQKPCISLLFSSKQHPEHTIFPETSQSIPAVMLHFYFQLLFPSQRTVVISPHLKKPVPPRSTRKGEIPTQLISLQPSPQLCYTAQLRTRSVPWHEAVALHSRMDGFKFPPYLLFSVRRWALLLGLQNERGKAISQHPADTHTRKPFHEEEFCQPYPKKLWARLTHPRQELFELQRGRKMPPALPGNVCNTRKLQGWRRGRGFSERHPWVTVQRETASKGKKHSAGCARRGRLTQLQYPLPLWRAWLIKQLLHLFLHLYIYIHLRLKHCTESVPYSR